MPALAIPRSTLIGIQMGFVNGVYLSVPEEGQNFWSGAIGFQDNDIAVAGQYGKVYSFPNSASLYGYDGLSGFARLDPNTPVVGGGIPFGILIPLHEGPQIFLEVTPYISVSDNKMQTGFAPSVKVGVPF